MYNHAVYYFCVAFGVPETRAGPPTENECQMSPRRQGGGLSAPADQLPVV